MNVDQGVEERLWIDTRPPREFAAGHRPGALNLQWGWNQLETLIDDYVPDLATPITLRANTQKDARKAFELLDSHGYEDVLVAGDLEESATLELMTASELESVLSEPDAPRLIDVRTPGEWESGVIEGALRVEESEAPDVLEQLDPEASYVIICEGGYRSSQLASWMRRHGFKHVVNVVDGMAAWRREHP